jgi:hypothetical protein
MRKRQQQQILEILDTLHEAQSAGLYADAQDVALVVREFIDQLAGEGTKTARLLMEYYEMLFEASKGGIGEKPLHRHLQKIGSSVCSELSPDKIEIVFLCYNASMSDSVLSIYQAAKADPDCEAVWLPIPYYEKKPDGTFGRMHYEGPEHYHGIECADWREYDIEARHPDIIVTYNPYDEGNYATSVHPLFYCERLRGLTDLLLYVPYYVSVVDDVEEHFCLLAGTIHAHRVVVQSEKIRGCYVSAFKKRFGNRLGRPEEKFVALGSPKFDAAVNMGRCGSGLPGAWLKLIQGPDGNRRKVVLYNARLTDMAAGIENQLAKLQDILACFKDRADVVLWWRPHPLNMETLKSMRPQFAGIYAKIVENYRREGWGIYDDTSDLNGALAESDAYYGDYSSVIALCGVSGKPVMVLRNNVLSTDAAASSAAFANQMDGGEYFWFTLYQANALFRMDKETWEAEYMGGTPQIDNIGLAFGRIAKCHGKLFLAPQTADFIGVYDMESSQFGRIALEDMCAPGRYKFHEVATYGEYVYMFGFAYPAIIRINARTQEITYITDWVGPLQEQKINEDGLWLGDGHVCGKEIVLPAESANAALVFDMDSCQSKIIPIPSKNSGYVKICFDGDSYWLSARHSGGTAVKWHPVKGTEEIEIPDGWADGDYWNMCYANGFAWYFPTLGNTAFKVDTATDRAETAEPFMPECRLRESKGADQLANYIVAYADGDIIYAHTGVSNTHISYNTKTGERREEAIAISAGDRKRVVDDIVLRRCDRDMVRSMYDCVFGESTVFALEDFIGQLTAGSGEVWESAKKIQIETCRENIANADGTAGQKIYDDIRRTVLG